MVASTCAAYLERCEPSPTSVFPVSLLACMVSDDCPQACPKVGNLVDCAVRKANNVINVDLNRS